MYFNSISFLVFFILVYGAYLVLYGRKNAQNALLLVASYVFYGFWDWRFLGLIVLSTVIDYGAGLGLDSPRTQANPRRRRGLLAVSLLANLGILGFFKYFNFFAESLAGLLQLVHIQADPVTLRIILPVGISFYTFQTMSYTLDVYHRELPATRDFLSFATFVAFFPQLVAGPIERARHLLPQFETSRRILAPELYTGLYLIAWGYFKKMVVADNCGLIADRVFNHYQHHAGLSLWVGVAAFAIQIYGDFSGYSDIARGLAKMMGFDLMVNFRIPYAALSPNDFWKRWHISLSTWLRDYLYIPLGGNRKGPRRTYLNLVITMALGGLWHGAAWNFVLWGLFHGTILCMYRWAEQRAPNLHLPRLLRWAIMTILTLLGWVLFRCNSLEQIRHFFLHLWSWGGLGASLGPGSRLLFYCAPLILVEALQERTRDLLAPIRSRHYILHVFFFAFVLVWLCLFGVRESMEFIYFQF